MDEQPPAIIPPAPLPVIRRTSEKKFVKAIIVRTPDGEKLSVPSTVEANRARTQLISARATELYTKQLKSWSNSSVPLSPKELRDFIEAGKTLQELNDAAYGAGPIPDGGNPLTGLGQLVQGAVMAGAAVANGANASLAEDMRKLTELNRKATAERKGKEIIVEEEK